MAGISDVENALTALISGAVYPNGSSPSQLGYPVKVYAGWPDPDTLNADMSETTAATPTAAHVSVYPLPGERNVTRYPQARREGPIASPTYTITALGQVVTLGGAAPSPYAVTNLAVVVDGFAYVYQATAGQTADQVAAGLFAALTADFPDASISGAQITLPDVARVWTPRIGRTAGVTREVRRQEKQFQVSVWTSHPDSRSALYDLFDPVLADTPFLTLADGQKARLIYKGAREDDFTQKQRIYRRSAIWCVEYATLVGETATQIIAPAATLRDAFDVAMITVPGEPSENGSGGWDGGQLDFSVPENSELLPGL